MWESNDVDFSKKISQFGHNIALMASKGDLFKNPDLSLSLFAMANFGHKDASTDDILELYPMAAFLSDEDPHHQHFNLQ